MTHDLHALPADLFTKPSIMNNFSTFCEFIKGNVQIYMKEVST